MNSLELQSGKNLKKMDNIKVEKMMDVIVIEKYNGNTLLKGGHLFCGCCGESLAFLTSDITFPFNSKELMEVLADISFEITILGLRHKICEHTMFSFRKGWGFMSVENYYAEQKAES